MKITFDTKNVEEVAEVLALLTQGAVKVTETATEAPKEKKTTPSKARAKKEPEEAKTEPEETVKEVGIKLDDLKESAKNAVDRSSREDVKKTISEFGDKLVNVAEADYGKLYKKLQELGA